jgi:hypothetical protein
MKNILEGDALEQRARELGVDTQGGPITQSISGRLKRADDYELQKRVVDAERSIRESRLWLIALVSAIASVVSALTALLVVFRK